MRPDLVPVQDIESILRQLGVADGDSKFEKWVGRAYREAAPQRQAAVPAAPAPTPAPGKPPPPRPSVSQGGWIQLLSAELDEEDVPGRRTARTPAALRKP